MPESPAALSAAGMVRPCCRPDEKSDGPQDGVYFTLERFAIERGRTRGAPRRPARSEWKKRVFSTKRQALWFEAHNVSN